MRSRPDFQWLGGLVERLPLPDLVKSFLKDGLIGGVGSVIVFLPQIVDPVLLHPACSKIWATWRARRS